MRAGATADRASDVAAGVVQRVQDTDDWDAADDAFLVDVVGLAASLVVNLARIADALEAIAERPI